MSDLNLNELTTEELLKDERGRCAESKKTHCPHGHSYSGQNLRYDKNKKRFCRSCSFYRNNKMPITRKAVYAI